MHKKSPAASRSTSPTAGRPKLRGRAAHGIVLMPILAIIHGLIFTLMIAMISLP